MLGADGGLAASLTAKGSGAVTGFAEADGFFAVPAMTESVEAGSPVKVQLIGAPTGQTWCCSVAIAPHWTLWPVCPRGGSVDQDAFHGQHRRAERGAEWRVRPAADAAAGHGHRHLQHAVHR